jgi:hypothetical protein
MSFCRPVVLYKHGPRWAIVLLLAVASVGRAQWYVPESVGARGGFSSTGQAAAEFKQAEGFADWNIPLKTESDSGWFLQTKLNLSAGWLGGNGINAVVGTLGPAVAFGKRRFPLSLEGGISPTVLSEYHFGSVNFGRELQFTSYLGVNVDLSRHWRVGYRYQHMSNAGFARSNPGLNLNMFALSCLF